MRGESNLHGAAGPSSQHRDRPLEGHRSVLLTGEQLFEFFCTIDDAVTEHYKSGDYAALGIATHDAYLALTGGL